MDDTADFISKTFPSVRLFVNKKNYGKAFSMNYGAEKVSGDVIFFCDADLVGFTGEMADTIIKPVLDRRYDMFVGIRNNKMQKSFLPFAINSGERAIRKELWQKLPLFYKHRFRIEVGLNYMVRYCTEKGMGYKIMPYYQTLKEEKYGFWRGQKERWSMNIDVVVGWMRAVYDFYFPCHIFVKSFITRKI